MNVLLKKFGLLSVIAVWGLAACNDECSCEPNGPTCEAESSSSEMDVIQSSSNVLVSSSTIAIPDMVLSSSSVVEGASSLVESSSSLAVKSSSSRVLSRSSQMLSSSSAVMLDFCYDFIDMCGACDGYFCSHANSPCFECSNVGEMGRDCKTGLVFTCVDHFGDHYWAMEEVSCLDVALTQCTGENADCGRKRCTIMAPETIADCNSGDEYVCTDEHWTLTNLSKFCNSLPDNQKKRMYDNCDKKTETKAYDCVQRKELVCNIGSWREAEAVVGEDCAFESDMRMRAQRDDSDSENGYIIIFTVCSEGKWVEYKGTDLDGIALEECRRHPMHRTPCDESSPKEISSGDCTFKCRDGEYIFVPPMVR